MLTAKRNCPTHIHNSPILSRSHSVGCTTREGELTADIRKSEAHLRRERRRWPCFRDCYAPSIAKLQNQPQHVQCFSPDLLCPPLGVYRTYINTRKSVEQRVRVLRGQTSTAGQDRAEIHVCACFVDPSVGILSKRCTQVRICISCQNHSKSLRQKEGHKQTPTRRRAVMTKASELTSVGKTRTVHAFRVGISTPPQ